MGKSKKNGRGPTPERAALRAQADAAQAATLKKGRKKKSEPELIGDIVKNGATRVREPAERREYMMKVPVRASAKEIADAAGQMAHQVRLDEQLREETREVNADLRARRNAVHERMKELADTIEKGTRREERRVRERLIVETNTIEIVRCDTGEIVETRAASASDRQESLFPGEDDEPDEDARQAQAADKAIRTLDAVASTSIE